MATRKQKSVSISEMFQEKHRQIKQEAGASFRESSKDQASNLDKRPTYETQGGILNIIDYIESPYGLNIRPYPLQKFIIKLYYHLPLEDKEKTIVITDMFRERVLYRFTEKETLEYLYNEGRCNIKEQDHPRRELVLVCGRRSGKCVKDDTLVYTSDGLVPIGSLGSKIGSEYQDISTTVVQENGKRSVTSHFYNNGESDTIRIRTWSGYEMEATPNHRVRGMLPSGEIGWYTFEEIKNGTFLGIHRDVALWPSDPVDLTPYFSNLKGKKDTPLPSVLTEEWATLLGVLVGDGSWGYRNCIQVTVGPYPDWLKQVEDIFDATIGNHTTIFPANRTSYVAFYGEKVREFLHRLGYIRGCKTDEKRIPWVIFRSPKSHVAGFLRGLFETDGCVEKRGVVTFSTASKQLAYEIQLLLLNFGIVCRVRPKINKNYNRTYYHINLLGTRSHEIFQREIGFLSERKKSKLSDHMSRRKTCVNKSSTESIPNQKEMSIKLYDQSFRDKRLRLAMGNLIKKSSKDDLTYPRIRKILDVCSQIRLSGSSVDHFREILNANYFYDPVVEITHQKGYVVDLSVPEGHSYVAAGFTSHNTLFSSVFASYELYRLLCLGDPQSYYGLPPNNRIQIISVATDKDQAGILFGELSGHINKFDYFSPFVSNNTQSYINFRTPADIERNGPSARGSDGKFISTQGKAGIRVTFKSSIAKGLRGPGNIVIILDELAHFKNKGQSSGKDIYDAITPAAAAFSPKDPETGMPVGDVDSRIIDISSPLGKSGWFYDLFCQAMSGGPESYNKLAIQAPTWEMNPTVQASFLKEKYHSDPNTFMVEFGAQFSDSSIGWLERDEDLLACCPPNYAPVTTGIPRHPYFVGLDIGLKGDSTVVVIGHREPDNLIVQDYHESWKAGVPWEESNPHLASFSCEYASKLQSVDRIDFDAIGEWLEILSRRFSFVEGLFDRWNGIPLEQDLHKRGMAQFRSEYFSRDFSSKMAQTFKMLMIDGKLKIYNYPVTATAPKAPHIQELLALQATYQSKYVVTVSKPKSPKASDDYFDALVRMVWLAHESKGKEVYIAPARGGGRSAANSYSSQVRKAMSTGVMPPRISPNSLLGKKLRLRSPR